ncbi:unnamed protein product [Colias eurytheme]|nr:unnamed protein product [Colias eurytheme]
MTEIFVRLVPRSRRRDRPKAACLPGVAKIRSRDRSVARFAHSSRRVFVIISMSVGFAAALLAIASCRPPLSAQPRGFAPSRLAARAFGALAPLSRFGVT